MVSSPERMWIVGDSFRRATTPQLRPIGAFLGDLARGRFDGVAGLRLTAGLGLDEDDWAGLRRAVHARGLADRVQIDDAALRRVDRHTVHKQRDENVVIGHPRAVDLDRYEADIIFSDGTELLADHTADRQHVHGMLLIEAMIQLTTAAVAASAPPSPGNPRRYAVMHGCRFEFGRFVFALPATVSVRLVAAGEATAERVPLSAELSVVAAGRVVTTGRFDLNAFDPAHIFAVEDGQARKTIAAATCEPHRPGPEQPPAEERA